MLKITLIRDIAEEGNQAIPIAIMVVDSQGMTMVTVEVGSRATLAALAQEGSQGMKMVTVEVGSRAILVALAQEGSQGIITQVEKLATPVTSELEDALTTIIGPPAGNKPLSSPKIVHLQFDTKYIV